MTKQEAIEYISSLPDNAEVSIALIADPPYVSAGQIIRECGISRQLLHYYAKHGYVRTAARGKQKRYCLDDANKMLEK